MLLSFNCLQLFVVNECRIHTRSFDTHLKVPTHDVKGRDIDACFLYFSISLLNLDISCQNVPISISVHISLLPVL